MFRDAKTPAGLIGAAAVVAMGILGAAGGGGQTAVVVSGGSMTTGVTETLAYPTALATSVAVPLVKATPYGGGGS